MIIGCDCMSFAAVSVALRELIASVSWVSVACAKGCDVRPYFWHEIMGGGRSIGKARV
jgi:hypothetical protein